MSDPITRGGWTIRSTKTEYEDHWLKLNVNEVITPGGQPRVYATVDRRDAVYIIALTKNNEIYFIHEFRFPSGKVLISVPAGGIEPGKDSLSEAKKELREEAGLTANSWELLGKNIVDPGSQKTVVYNYLATDIDDREVGNSFIEHDEDIQKVEKYSITKVKEMILSGEIECSSTIAALNYLFLKLESK